MTGISGITRDDEIVNGSCVQGVVTVGTSQTEAKVGGSRLADRQILRIFNKSNATVYWGPTGLSTTTGEPIYKDQWVDIPAGDQLAIFLIAGSAGNDVVVSEFA